MCVIVQELAIERKKSQKQRTQANTAFNTHCQPRPIILRQKSPGTSSIMYIHMTRTLNLSHFLSLAMQLRASEIRECARFGTRRSISLEFK